MQTDGRLLRDVDARSMELGVVVPSADGMPQPLLETLTLGNPTAHVPPERLHADALVRFFHALSKTKVLAESLQLSFGVFFRK